MRPGKPKRFVAIREDGGDWCGHWHRYFVRACECSSRQERFFRRRYNDRRRWDVHTFSAEDGKLS